jgi:6-phospho-3-hexuloisomerase
LNEFQRMAATVSHEIETALRQVDAAEVEELKNAILSAARVFLVGKGRSGLQMRAFAMRLMHMGLTVYVVDDITTPRIASGDLLLIGSGSGRTPSLVQYASIAKSEGATLGLITIDVASSIAAQADYLVRIQASSTKLEADVYLTSVQPMGTLYEQVLGILLDILIVQLMESLGLTEQEMFSRHANLE